MSIGSLNYFDRVFFDSITGVAGIEWPVGTAQLPSDVIADVITILTARNLHTIEIHGTLVLTATMNHYCFTGNEHEAAGDILNLGGQDVDDSYFEGLIITGVQGGVGLATFKDCIFVSTLPIPMSGFRGLARKCALFGGLGITLATGNTDYADFDHCTSIHGTATVIIGSPNRVSFKEFSGGLILTAQAAGDVLVRGISGYLEIDAMTGGTLDIYAHGVDILINANCTGGTINIVGNARVIDNSVGAVVTDHTIDLRAANINDQISGILVQVPFFNEMDTIQANTIILFEFDALGATIREVYVNMYLPLHATATFTPSWSKTRANDLVTFTTELDPVLAAIPTPAANAVYSYKLGEIAQGLQARFSITMSNHAGGVTVDAFAVVLMVI